MQPTPSLSSCETVTDPESSSQRSDPPSSATPPEDASPHADARKAGPSSADAEDVDHADADARGETAHDEPNNQGSGGAAKQGGDRATERNAPPMPHRSGAGRPHADEASEQTTANAEALGSGDNVDQEDTSDSAERDVDGSHPVTGAAASGEIEHEVFILTPEVMRAWAWNSLRWVTYVVGSYYLLCTLLIISYRWVEPPTTGVQLQRSIAAWWDGNEAYETIYRPVPLASIDDDLELAVVAAEDTRFFQHTGIDWEAVGEAIEDNRERGFTYRGGSTITQQLAKNLFQTTHSSFLRKGMEVPLTYLIEIFLPKDRILELYLNVIEWGPGVFGAEAAAQHHYGSSARVISRYRAAALAACIPNPLARTPGRMNRYTRTILGRMYQLERIEPRFAR